MDIAHRHLDRPVAHELTASAHVNSCHHKSRWEGVPAARAA
jgi:hypothetical protein